MKKNSKKIIIPIIAGVVVLCLLELLVYAIFNATSYESTIKRLKHKTHYDVDFIPDSLPADATGWSKTSMPTILQGSGYMSVTIECSERYIEQVVNEYEGKALKAFYGYTTEAKNSTFVEALMITDAGQMYVNSEYDENNQYKHPQYKFDYKEDDVSGIYFYESTDGLSYVYGCIDDDKYDVRGLQLPRYANMDKKEGVIVYILYDNDDWNHSHINLIAIDKESNTVTYFAG